MSEQVPENERSEPLEPYDGKSSEATPLLASGSGWFRASAVVVILVGLLASVIWRCG
jgi:hypothetical protein